MKTLIICDPKGKCVLTLTDVNDKYSCSITDVAENQTVIAKDFEANKIVTVAENTSDYKKQQKKNELMKKNELYNAIEENKKLKKVNEELNEEIKEELQKLKSANVEIVDYINIITNEE